jgi:hypothetical protein
VIEHELVSRELTRSAGVRRRALMTLGATGLVAALGRAPAASAKQSPGKKRKKRCKRQQQACVDQARTHCLDKGIDASFCESNVLQCCQTCKVGTSVICMLDAFTMLG